MSISDSGDFFADVLGDLDDQTTCTVAQEAPDDWFELDDQTTCSTADEQPDESFELDVQTTCTVAKEEPPNGWFELDPPDKRLWIQTFGRQKFYKCAHKECDFENHRKCHAISHYERIHVKNGIPMPNKRKYQLNPGTSVRQVRVRLVNKRTKFSAVVCKEIKKSLTKALSHSKSTVVEVKKTVAKRGTCNKITKMNGIAEKKEKHVKFLAEIEDDQVDFLAGMQDTGSYFPREKSQKMNLFFGEFKITWGSRNDSGVDL